MQRSLLTFLVVCSITIVAHGQCSLSTCGTITYTNIASCQFTCNWTSVAGADHYTFQYKLSTASSWIVISNIGNVTSYTLTGLSASQTYKVKVAGVCTNGAVGPYISGSKKTTACSTPANVTISNLGSTVATASWTPFCGTSVFTLKYKLHSSTQWTIISNISATSYTLSGLVQSTSYDVEVMAVCGNINSKISGAFSFTTCSSLSGNNVLLIVLDDARQDEFTPDGGPSWFADTNITRIANEGVNFKNCFPSESTCAASRSSIITGLYPHKTGVLNNAVIPPVTQKTIAEILHDNNYYTGFVGKYHLSNAPQLGYDYWMENTSFDYYNATWNVNGIHKIIAAHRTDAATDSTIGFLKRLPAGKRFYIELAYAAPHSPYKPRYQDSSLYLNETLPLAVNPQAFAYNYPDFIYPCRTAPSTESKALRGTYQLLAGVDDDLGKIFAQLKTMGLFDSTLIIFTNDNGFLFGEHNLDGKKLNYEESIRLPLYMRYPPKIAAGSVVSNEIAMNIDLAPTILDYCTIPNTYSMDGISLMQVLAGNLHRSEMFYEYFAEGCMPDIRSVRSLDHIYTEYGCNSVTQEFFDLINDPLENTNLINNAGYDSLINLYRDKLTYWETYYAYSTPYSSITCALANPLYQRVSEEAEVDLPMLRVFPNPASSNVHVLTTNMGDATEALLVIRNAVGKEISEHKMLFEHGSGSLILSVESLATGIYLLSVKAEEFEMNASLMIEGK